MTAARGYKSTHKYGEIFCFIWWLFLALIERYFLIFLVASDFLSEHLSSVQRSAHLLSVLEEETPIHHPSFPSQ